MRWVSNGRLRILDLDIETRKVGFHEGGRFGPDGCEPITIAASWADSRKVEVWLLPEHSMAEMLGAFAELYNTADMVTGHYIRRFDLPVLNAAMFENGLPLLGPKLVHDTKQELRAMAGLSKSQENLGELLQLAEAKYHMNDYRWRKASRLEPEGMALARKRATRDVRQHKTMRLGLHAEGALRPPREWRP